MIFTVDSNIAFLLLLSSYYLVSWFILLHWLSKQSNDGVHMKYGLWKYIKEFYGNRNLFLKTFCANSSKFYCILCFSLFDGVFFLWIKQKLALITGTSLVFLAEGILHKHFPYMKNMLKNDVQIRISGSILFLNIGL